MRTTRIIGKILFGILMTPIVIIVSPFITDLLVTNAELIEEERKQYEKKIDELTKKNFEQSSIILKQLNT
ncbi:MAG: hypothetical protein RL059_1075 [Bacteroidota bacterium]|jgi:hypothetical protein